MPGRWFFPGCCCESNKIATQRENNLWILECYRPESWFLDQRTRTSQTSNVNAKNFSRKKATWRFCQTSKGLYKIWPFFGGLTLGNTLKHFWIAFWILYRFSLAMSVMAKSLKVRTTSGRPVKSTLNWSLKIELRQLIFFCLGWVLCFAGFHKILLQIFLQSLDCSHGLGLRKMPQIIVCGGWVFCWIETLQMTQWNKRHHEFS